MPPDPELVCGYITPGKVYDVTRIINNDVIQVYIPESAHIGRFVLYQVPQQDTLVLVDNITYI